LADPLVATVTYAVTRGFVDFSEVQDTESGWLGVRLRLDAAANAMAAEVLRLDALRAIVLEPHAGAEGARVTVKALEAVDARVRPWTQKGAQGSSDLDLIAKWYILNAPDALRTAGVDIARLQS